MNFPKISHADVRPAVVLADIHQPDEAVLPAARNRKYASKMWPAELFVVLLVGDLPPALPVSGRLDEPRFQIPPPGTSPFARIA
jgi:hypothetical protein